MTTYTVENVNRLLRALISPSREEREAADEHVFVLASVAQDGNSALSRLIDQATDAFGAESDAFFREVTRVWIRASGRGPFSLYGLGVAAYLITQAPRLGALVDVFVDLLGHPVRTLADASWKILGSMPGQAQAAITPMLGIAFGRGPNFGPDQPMRWLAGILDAHPSAAHLLLDALETPAKDERASVAAALAREMKSPPDEVWAAMLRNLDRVEEPTQRYDVMRAVIDVAGRRPGAFADEVLSRAESMLDSSEPAERGAGAWGVAKLGTPAAHEASLLALLRDRDWRPRADAAGAASAWTEPSAELVLAVAEVLTGDDVHDGWLHSAALETLIAWGPRSAPAVGTFAAWLVTEPDDPPHAEIVWRLVAALGPAAEGLRPAVARLVLAYRGGRSEADHADEELGPPLDLRDVVDERTGEVDGSTHWALLARVGIDRNESIPSTPSATELAAMPEPVDQLARWLRGA